MRNAQLHSANVDKQKLGGISACCGCFHLKSNNLRNF